MKMGMSLKHHDWAYVERRGGPELLTHLRAGDTRAEHRRVALTRAYGRFQRAIENGRPDPEVGGHGLLVLQQAMLVAEDLGGLLHAFGQPDPWTALRSTSIPTLDAAYERARTDPDAVLIESFRLSTERQLGEEGLSHEQLGALTRLRGATVARWRGMLDGVADLWVQGREIAKATMHGFPVVAGSLILGPPPAGELAELVQGMMAGVPEQRFAVAMPTTLHGKTLNTELQPIPLGNEAVRFYRGRGNTATRLYEELCDAQAGSIMSGHGAVISFRMLDVLTANERAAIEPLRPGSNAGGSS